MTRYELHIDEIVVRGVPLRDHGADLGALVEQRLATLMQDGERLPASREVVDTATLADLVASDVWAEVRRSGAELGHGS
jgi:hypothetical protein